jgi:hypothetical protein
MSTIKVGDTVRVVSPGMCYDLYTAWVERNAPDYLDKFRCGDKLSESPKRFKLGKVVAVAPHGGLSEPNSVLAGVLIEDQLFPLHVHSLQVIDDLTTDQMLVALKPGQFAKVVGHMTGSSRHNGSKIAWSAHPHDPNRELSYLVWIEGVSKGELFNITPWVLEYLWKIEDAEKEVTREEALQALAEGLTVKHVPDEGPNAPSAVTIRRNGQLQTILLDRLFGGKWYIVDGEK